MSERALLERFDLVTNDPENIPLLRRYIVNLAIRGKLLERPDADISASEMLNRIEAKAAILIKQGRLKKQKAMDPIRSEELPGPDMAHRTFERLGNLASLQKGLTGIQGATPGEFPLVTTGEGRSTCDHYDFDGTAAIVPMVSSTGHGHASLNRLHYQEGKFALGTILCAVFPIDEKLISARFLFEYLTAFRAELLVSKMNGTANVTLTIGKIAEVPVPIITPTVQGRVDELMSLCDQLEAATHEREKGRDRLLAASLQQLNQPSGNEPCCAGDHFIFDHLPRLTTRPAHIKQLRQTILNLAVRGKLVPQDPDDEPATELLHRVAVERSDLVKKGSIRREPPLEPVHPDAHPFAIPDNWIWARIGSAVLFTQYGTSLKSHTADNGVPVLTMGNIQDGRIIYRSEKRIPESSNELPALYLRKLDILYNRTNSAELVGKTGIYLDEDDARTFASYLIRIRSSPTSGCPHYLNLAMNTSEFRETQIIPLIKKQTGQANVNGTALKNMLVALPPLAEQYRIVAKVDELMKLCDQLEAQVTITAAATRRLLKAALHGALCPILQNAA